MKEQAVLNIFGTGRCVLTGMKSMDEIPYIFNHFMNKAVRENIFW